MIIVFSLVVAAILIGSSYIITEKNAKYYLSGYWNLSSDKKQQIDLKGFLTNWKRIMWTAGVIILVAAILMYLIPVKPKYALLMILIVSELSFIALIFAGKKANKNPSI